MLFRPLNAFSRKIWVGHKPKDGKDFIWSYFLRTFHEKNHRNKRTTSCILFTCLLITIVQYRKPFRIPRYLVCIESYPISFDFHPSPSLHYDWSYQILSKILVHKIFPKHILPIPTKYMFWTKFDIPASECLIVFATLHLIENRVLFCLLYQL